MKETALPVALRRALSQVTILFVIFFSSARADYNTPQIQEVPLDRLIQNLENQISENGSKDPKPAYWQRSAAVHALARLHAMAFAYKFSLIKACDFGKGLEPIFIDYLKPSDDHPYRTFREFPLEYPSTRLPEEELTAKAHLERAIELYKQIKDGDRNYIQATLGLGWCLDQAGKKAEAAEKFREVLGYYDKVKWRGDWGFWGTAFVMLERTYLFVSSLSDGSMPNDFSVSTGIGKAMEAEAAEYLIRDLDPKRDSAEIDRVRKQIFHLVKQYGRTPRAITPIVIPLEDGLTVKDLVDRTSAVNFDLDGTARPQRWSWITPKGAWLVYKTENEPMSGLNLFGAVTFWSVWNNGYDALCSLDDNGDGIISGTELKNLALWQDRNSNGKVDPGETISLEEAGITGLSCDTKWDGEEFYSPNGVRLKSGHFRPSFDVFLTEQKFAD